MPSAEYHRHIGSGGFHRFCDLNGLFDHRTRHNRDAHTYGIAELPDNPFPVSRFDRGIDNIHSQSSLLGDRREGQQRQGRRSLDTAIRGKEQQNFLLHDLVSVTNGNRAIRRLNIFPRISSYFRRTPGHTACTSTLSFTAAASSSSSLNVK